MPIAFNPADHQRVRDHDGTTTHRRHHRPPLRTTASTGTAITLSSSRHTFDQRISRRRCPDALLNLLMTDSKTKVLNSPQLRASDGQKATLNIGERYPYATGSFQPGVGTVGVSPLVSTQFNYADIGVNVEITPQVHSAEEVTLHVEVDSLRRRAARQPGRHFAAGHRAEQEHGRYPAARRARSTFWAV